MKKSLLFFASCFCVALLFGQTNLAFNKITTASGYATSWGHKNEFAVDGKFDTRWQASQAEGALISTGKYTQDYWIYVDLTQNYSIGAVRIFWEAAFANDYNIDVSLDGNVWETIKEIRNSDGDIDLSYLASQTGRYLRIHTLVGNMVWAPSIFELQVFAANDVPAPDNFSENFEKGLPTNLSFAETNGSFYSQQISTTLTNSSLVITAASGVSATSSYKLNFDLSTTHNLDLATFPKISFDYQASKNATLQITATTQLGASIDLGTFPLYGSAYLLSANLAVTATDLAQVSKLEFKITTADAQTISLDNFQMGRYATNFSFAILAPSVSAKVLEGADVLFATNAQVGKVVFYRNSQKVGEASAWPYQYKLTGLTRGLQNLKAEYYDTEGKLVSTLERSFVCEPTGGTQYRDAYTENLYKALKKFASAQLTMFGMANPTTIGYSNGPQNTNINQSDCKDITGSHPAFHESDLMWYNNKTFMQTDINAMKKAHERGAVIGYCWHMRGQNSGEFYLKKDGAYTTDRYLMRDIVANPDRATNPALDWYLTQYDQLAIPLFNEIATPIVFRPLHEMTGNWFWWGSDGANAAENFKKLFQLTVKYLRDKGIKNLLYAWAPNLDSKMDFYPGDEYVDVIGYDAYGVGVDSWATQATVKDDLDKLTDYAAAHDKVAAMTETGLGKDNNIFRYCDKYPEWWTKNIFDPIFADPKASRLAWVMTWYNADWNNDQKGTFWIPYQGLIRPNADKAIADFKKLYDYPRSIFELDMPDMTGIQGNLNELFIYPKTLNLEIGQKFNFIGGIKADWMNNTDLQWSVNSANASISATGELTATSHGAVTVTLTHGGKSVTATVQIGGATNNENTQITNTRLYPNPADIHGTNLYLGNETKESKIEIFDIFGHKLRSSLSSAPIVRIDTTDLNQGIYFVKVSQLDKQAIHKLLIN